MTCASLNGHVMSFSHLLLLLQNMVDISFREDGETLPLIIRPRSGGNNTSADFLREWVRDNKKLVERKMLEHGEWTWPR